MNPIQCTFLKGKDLSLLRSIQRVYYKCPVYVPCLLVLTAELRRFYQPQSLNHWDWLLGINTISSVIKHSFVHTTVTDISLCGFKV